MHSITHLKTTTQFLEEENKSNSELIIDEFIESCLKLDASIFEPYMQEDDVFENNEKYQFLAELKELFDFSRMKTLDDFTVKVNDEKCMGCRLGKMVKNFEVINNKTKLSEGDFGFVIELENEMLKDISRCWFYREEHGEWIKPDGLPALFLPKYRGH